MRSLEDNDEAIPIVLQSPNSITAKSFKDLVNVILEIIDKNND